MGMGASQVRLLALTSRQHEIGRQLQHYSLEKQSLTREMQKISKNYNQALQGKVLKWSNNAGVDYVDLSYSTLMRPNSANSNKPVLLTNSSGKIVIDQKYKKYAEMISPEGKIGGDWASNRTKILSELTGIPESTIDKYAETEQAVYDSNEVKKAAANERDKIGGKAISHVSAQAFARNWGTVGGHDFKSTSGSINLGDKLVATANLKNNLQTIAMNMKQYLPEGDAEKFKAACDDFYDTYESIINNYGNGTSNDTKKSVESNSLPIRCSGNKFSLDIEDFIEGVMTNYMNQGGSYDTDSKGNIRYSVAKDGINSDSYNKYLESINTANDALEEYKTKVDVDNQIMTADQESLINFYDQLFTAVVENGWIDDNMVSNDSEYLNQMLQNNEYYITTMAKNENEETMNANGERKSNVNKYVYNTDLWSNTDKIFAVNDEYIRQEALTDYEYQKSIISAKESRVDERMRNLETEQSAIKQMIQGVEQVRNKNVERTFSIFT